jgi:hypothetical protein
VLKSHDREPLIVSKYGVDDTAPMVRALAWGEYSLKRGQVVVFLGSKHLSQPVVRVLIHHIARLCDTLAFWPNLDFGESLAQHIGTGGDEVKQELRERKP